MLTVFIDSILQCGLHCSPGKPADRVSLENAMEPQVVLSFYVVQLWQGTTPSGQPQRSCIQQHISEVGSLDRALRHSLAAKQFSLLNLLTLNQITKF